MDSQTDTEKISLPEELWERFKERPIRHIVYLVGIYFALKAGKKVYAGEEPVLIEQVKGLILTCAQLGQKFSLDVWHEVQNFAKITWELEQPPASPAELITEMVDRIKKWREEEQKKHDQKDEANYNFFHNLALETEASRKKGRDGKPKYFKLSFVSNTQATN